jgi:predicted amidohydrolase
MALTKIALAQYPISYFENQDQWASHTQKWVREAAATNAKILVFPEYGAMELTSLLPKEVQEDLHAQIVQIQQFIPFFQETFSQLAKELDVIIVAPSIPFSLGDSFVNRCCVFSAEGMGHQDKWFMTRFENESWGISSGGKRLALFQSKWGNFGIQICYDIEFPVGAHLLAANGADFILVPSCTETLRGATRVHVGARARALEQQLYTCVSQTVQNALWSPAVDINFGYAAVYSAPDYNLPESGILSTSVNSVPLWHYEILDFSKNEFIRKQGQVFNFRDMQESMLSPEITVEFYKL